MYDKIHSCVRLCRLLPLLSAFACGPTEVLVGDAPGVSRVVAGVLGVTHEVQLIDSAITGDALAQALGTPAGIVAFDDGSFFFADRFRRRLGHVSPSGVLSWPVGRGLCGFPGLGGVGDPGDVCFADPTGLAAEPGGALLIADRGAHTVYRFIPDANRVERVFGAGIPGLAADGGTAVNARTARPTDVAVGPDGSIYVAESFNNRVVRIDGDGVVRSFAGSGLVGDSGDGGAAVAALLTRPEGLAIMGDTIYIADSGNHRIRRVIGGVIEAYAGVGAAGFTGDGGPVQGALFARPGSMATLGSLLFVADRDNNRVRLIRVGPDSIDTFGGTGIASIGADLLEIGRTPLAGPVGVAAAGRAVFIADSGAFVVRRVVR